MSLSQFHHDVQEVHAVKFQLISECDVVLQIVEVFVRRNVFEDVQDFVADFSGRHCYLGYLGFEKIGTGGGRQAAYLTGWRSDFEVPEDEDFWEKFKVVGRPKREFTGGNSLRAQHAAARGTRYTRPMITTELIPSIPKELFRI